MTGLAALALCAGLSAGALDPSPSIDAPATLPAEPIVVTASRTGDGPAAASVTTISSDEIDRLQPRSLLEALNDAAGVRAVSTGGPGGGSFVSVRGGEPNFTLVLLDGVRVNNPTNSKGGAFDFGTIDPMLVERVEISRDAGSAVHGSDALSGVINIRLIEPAAGVTRFTARAEGGSDGAYGGGLGMSSGWQGGGALLSGSWFDSGTDDPGSRLKRGQALGRVRQTIGGFEASLIGLYAHGDHSAFPEDSGGPLLALNRERETGSAELETIGFALRRTQTAAVRPNLTISFARQRDDSATPALYPGVLDGVPAITAHNRFDRFEATGDVTATRGLLTATIGGGVLRETGRSDGTIDFGFPLPVSFALARTTLSGFAEATLEPVARLTLNAAGHYDHVVNGPHEWTGRAAIAWQPVADGPSLFARWAEGFKLPSFYALGHPLVGNPNLKPERSRNIEAGLEWRWGDRGQLRLAAYQNRFRDLIDFDPILFTTVNRDSVRVRGLEAEGRWKVTRSVTATAAIGHLSIDSATPLRGRPGWQGSAHVIWTVTPALELNGALRFNSSFHDSSVPTGLVTTSGHAEADLGLGYRLSPALRLMLALRNLGDSRYQDAVGWPARGRTVRATLGAVF